MDQDEVNEYVQRSLQLIEASPQMDEQNTKVRLVQPFLELLGWDLYSTEVELEYTIPMASGSTHVDYALLVGESPVVFVEAKPVRSDLTESEVRQLKSYMRQELDVDWGILTNGKEFEVLTKGRDATNGEEVSVVRFSLQDLTENPGVLELLSKESIRSGKADEIAEQVAQTNRVISNLIEEEDEVADAVSEAVESEVGEFPMDLEEQAREFVQSLVSALREQRRFVSENPPSKTDDPPTTSSGESDALQPRANKVVGKISRAEIEGNPDDEVAVFPMQESGLVFLKENAAWGFVRVGRDINYVAMYQSGDVGEVRYFAEVDELVDPFEADLERSPLGYGDRESIEDGKMVVKFKPGTLRELEDPVPFESKYPQALRYTTLGKIREAETTDDLF
ncbi:type I restriction enzyme HsdR N-terminal domain-containing protein [Halopelagius fulvigenes]|uniref:Type I restriction enzyme HsdR N-terminal domain-containing protein n=1 Tax=Halopelagius fulvigenes TaxID=1198324 RepID=A0ABD5U3N2_9EURY